MKPHRRFLPFTLIILIISINNFEVKGQQDTSAGRFQIQKDLLIMQFDCKTDVDDLQAAAALATFLSNKEYSAVNYHAVAGTYGIQEGLYVPPDTLFQLAFKDHWSNAHKDHTSAVEEVSTKILKTIQRGGDIWIAEAGQSDFTKAFVEAIQAEDPGIETTRRIHVVQHSNWNEESTSSEALTFVKKHTDYHKIPDGNAVSNGTPGFRDPDYTLKFDEVKDPQLKKFWQLAIYLSEKYNGQDGRYNNEAISAGGLDFSDFSEVCWIFGIHSLYDASEFFKLYAY